MIPNRLWCLVCDIPRPFIDPAEAERHLRELHGIRVWEATPVAQRRADGALIICAKHGDGRLVLRMVAPATPTQPGGEILEVHGLAVAYDRAADLNHLLDEGRPLCNVELPGDIAASTYQYAPLLWAFQMCAHCANVATASWRAGWRWAAVGEAAAAVWAQRYTAASWYALALCASLEQSLDVPLTVAVRVQQARIVVAVRAAEIDWQRGVVMEADPVGQAALTNGWIRRDDAAVLVFDERRPLTSEWAATDAAALLYGHERAVLELLGAPRATAPLLLESGMIRICMG